MKLSQLLYRLFDKKMNKKEKPSFSQRLSASEELIKEKEVFNDLKKILSQSADDSFGEGFVDRVMLEIEQIDEKSRWKQAQNEQPNLSFSFFKRQYAFAMAAVLLVTLVSPTLYSWITTTKYMTERGDTLTVTLPDNSIVQLNAESEISYSRKFNEGSRFITLDGEAYFDVKKGKHPFTVVFKNVSVQVMGTQFNVYTRGENIEVTVNEGVVKVGNDIEGHSQKEIILSEGQMVSFESDRQPGLPVLYTSPYTPGWINGKFIFDQVNLEDVCNEIERKFDVDIDFANTELEFITVTGVIEAENLSDVLATISLLTKRPYKFEKERYTFY